MAWGGSELGLFPPSLLQGSSQGSLLAPWDICHISCWEMAQAVLAITFLLLLLLLLAMAGGLRVGTHEHPVPCRAVCPAGGSWFNSPARSSGSHTHTEGWMLGPASRSLPVLRARCWPDPSQGSLWGGGQGLGEGMEPPSSRSRPLVSHMSRRCHTHLMWFLAGAAAALLRLIAARGALQTDNPAPRRPGPRLSQPCSAAAPWEEQGSDTAMQ